MKTKTVIFACLLLAGCLKTETEDEKRMACLADATEAPTAEGVLLKKNLCLLDYPVAVGQFANGDSNPNDPRLTFTKIQKP